MVRPARLVAGGYCKNNHHLVGENVSVIMRSDGSRLPRLNCLVCKREAAALRRASWTPEERKEVTRKALISQAVNDERKRRAGLKPERKITNSERYQKSKIAQLQRSRHERIVGSLSSSIVRDFEGALEETKPQCTMEPFADGSWPKSEWTDWSSNPEEEEPYQRPSRQAARIMCKGCPLIDMCVDYALATGQTHGVWGGRIVEDGKWEK